MNYLYTRSDHYKLFFERNRSDRLSKKLKISPQESKIRDLLTISLDYINEEIFDSPVNTDYQVEDNPGSKKIVFESSSKTEYRLDIFIIKENDKGIVNHLSFTENDKMYDVIPNNDIEFQEYENSYHRLTNKKEVYEVLNRIRFILNDLVNKNNISNYFCIGGSKLEKKNVIYEYFLKVVVGENGFDKLSSDVYTDTGWGLYFSI
jgi:hypothetical protein